MFKHLTQDACDTFLCNAAAGLDCLKSNEIEGQETKPLPQSAFARTKALEEHRTDDLLAETLVLLDISTDRHLVNIGHGMMGLIMIRYSST
jgi:hypothetical protein